MDELHLIQKSIDAYRNTNLQQILDYEKFSQFAIDYHSTAIEGSTLTELDTRLLIDEGLTPKGKPLDHSLMVKDHHEALNYVLNYPFQQFRFTSEFIRTINALVMKHTGGLYHTALGTIDASKGEYRKGNVSAGGSYFVSYDKVPTLTETFAVNINEQISQYLSDQDALLLSFSAHYDLVNIHPFYDGNGRTSRLVMNFIQKVFGLPLGIVFVEDRAEYIQSLIDTKKEGDITVFYRFMLQQYQKHLTNEVKKFQDGINTPPRQKKPGAPGFSIFL